MEVGGFDGAAGDGGEDVGGACGSGDAEDAVGGCAADFEVVVVPVAGFGIGSRVGGGEGAFEGWVQFGLAGCAGGLEGGGIYGLHGGVVGLDPGVAEATLVFRGTHLLR